MNNDLNVWVFAYEKSNIKLIEDETHIPLQVGARGRDKFCKLTDDIFDNISEKNPLYSELTGLYWVWKKWAPSLFTKGVNILGRHLI